MIRFTKLRQLQLAKPLGAGRQAFLTAASGLVRDEHELYVVCDDELHLGRFTLDSTQPCRVKKLLPGSLSKTPKVRKQEKPDLEILLRCWRWVRVQKSSDVGAHCCH
jgi:hypothetical protein